MWTGSSTAGHANGADLDVAPIGRHPTSASSSRPPRSGAGIGLRRLRPHRERLRRAGQSPTRRDPLPANPARAHGLIASRHRAPSRSHQPSHRTRTGPPRTRPRRRTQRPRHPDRHRPRPVRRHRTAPPGQRGPAPGRPGPRSARQLARPPPRPARRVRPTRPATDPTTNSDSPPRPPTSPNAAAPPSGYHPPRACSSKPFGPTAGPPPPACSPGDLITRAGTDRPPVTHRPRGRRAPPPPTASRSPCSGANNQSSWSPNPSDNRQPGAGPARWTCRHVPPGLVIVRWVHLPHPTRSGPTGVLVPGSRRSTASNPAR